MASGYRDRRAALQSRLEVHRARLAQLDDEAASQRQPRLTRVLDERVRKQRAAAAPTDDSVQALTVAEHAADEYERLLDEALGLGAELRKSVEPMLPRKEVVVRWSGLLALSLAFMLLAVHQVGLGDFMLRAFGIRVHRAANELSMEPLRRATIATIKQPPTRGTSLRVVRQLPDGSDLIVGDD